MPDLTKPVHVRRSELELLDLKVTRDGGAVRFLEGGRYGLVTSIMAAEIAPGSGPKEHSHPYAELFVVHEGHGRYTVGDAVIEADAGDVVIVPPNAWHTFLNPGRDLLRHTAIHESPRRLSTLRDGSDRA